MTRKIGDTVQADRVIRGTGAGRDHLAAYGQCPGCPEGELAEGGVCARHAEPVDPDGSLHYAGEGVL